MKKGIEVIIWVIQAPTPLKKDEKLLIKYCFCPNYQDNSLSSYFISLDLSVDKKIYIFYNLFKYIFLDFSEN